MNRTAEKARDKSTEKVLVPRPPRATPSTHPLTKDQRENIYNTVCEFLDGFKDALHTSPDAQARLPLSMVAIKIKGEPDPNNPEDYTNFFNTLVANACYGIIEKLRLKYPGIFPFFAPGLAHLTRMPLDDRREPSALARKCVHSSKRERVSGFSLPLGDDEMTLAYFKKMLGLGNGMARKRRNQLEAAKVQGTLSKEWAARYSVLLNLYERKALAKAPGRPRRRRRARHTTVQTAEQAS